MTRPTCWRGSNADGTDRRPARLRAPSFQRTAWGMGRPWNRRSARSVSSAGRRRANASPREQVLTAWRRAPSPEPRSPIELLAAGLLTGPRGGHEQTRTDEVTSEDPNPPGHEGDRWHLHRGRGTGKAHRTRCRPASRRAGRRRLVGGLTTGRPEIGSRLPPPEEIAIQSGFAVMWRPHQ